MAVRDISHSGSSQKSTANQEHGKFAYHNGHTPTTSTAAGETNDLNGNSQQHTAYSYGSAQSTSNWIPVSRPWNTQHPSFRAQSDQSLSQAPTYTTNTAAQTDTDHKPPAEPQDHDTGGRLTESLLRQQDEKHKPTNNISLWMSERQQESPWDAIGYVKRT